MEDFSCANIWNMLETTALLDTDIQVVELCVEPACLFGRCKGVAVPLRVVPSPTGLPSKRGPGLGSFSRADRGIGGVPHWFDI